MYQGAPPQVSCGCWCASCQWGNHCSGTGCTYGHTRAVYYDVRVTMGYGPSSSTTNVSASSSGSWDVTLSRRARRWLDELRRLSKTKLRHRLPMQLSRQPDRGHAMEARRPVLHDIAAVTARRRLKESGNTLRRRRAW